MVWALCAWALLACDDDDAEPGGKDGGPAHTRDGGSEPASARDGGTRPGPGVITPVQGIAGACLFKFTLAAEQFSACDSFDRLEACARLQCDLDQCVDQCTQYAACLAASTTACDLSCVPEDTCLSCMSTVMSCVINGTCLATIECTDAVEGGYCDQLRACCAHQPEDKIEMCDHYAAAISNVQGEASCLNLLSFLGTADAGFVACPIDDGPPKP